jgi:type I restriction enzyme S subunit
VYISIAGTTGLVGTVPEDLDGANLTENAAKLVIKDKKRLLKHFLVYALAGEGGQMEISQRTTKTSQPKLALMRIRQIPIPFPSPAEQRQIADKLSLVGQKITAEEQRKAALQALFKTMLHQLMTGRIRVEAKAEG